MQYTYYMRLLGIDYGTKRVGIAISDADAGFAIPTTVIKNQGDIQKLLKEVRELAEKNAIKEIVIGESKDFKGKDNSIMSESLEFKKVLEQLGFIVHMEPEFLTSFQAEKIQGKNDMLDASAAAIILQSFIDKRKFQK